jgi:hypothetical protein
MTVEQTQATMVAYLDALRTDSAYESYFAGDIAVTFVGTGEETRGSAAAK